MDATHQLEEMRRRFAHSLVGHWSTALGTAVVVMDQHWDIHPDGTGRWIDTGPFGHPRTEIRFEWRQSEPFVFELRELEFIDHEPAPEPPGDLDDDPSGQPEAWSRIRYDFIAVQTDCGAEIGLVDVAQIGRKFEGFYLSLAPLAHRGPPR